jgi:hypothetical protein
LRRIAGRRQPGRHADGQGRNLTPAAAANLIFAFIHPNLKTRTSRARFGVFSRFPIPLKKADQYMINREMLEELLGTEILEIPAGDARRSVTHWVDLGTLLAVLSGGTFLGLLALVGDPFASYLGLGWQIRIIYGFIGLSTIWQWVREPIDYSAFLSGALSTVLSGATLLGLIALVGDPITSYLGLGWQLRIICGFIGLSAIWKCVRQADSVTLLAVLGGATFLGLLALVGDPITSYLGLGWQIRITYGFIGLSAIWQWTRQPCLSAISQWTRQRF